MIGQHFVRILTTVSSEEYARRISIELVEQQLAACVQRTPIHSVYRWSGRTCENSEFQLAIKTCMCCTNSIKSLLSTNSPYEITQILVCPILDGDLAYLQWVQDNVSCSNKRL